MSEHRKCCCYPLGLIETELAIITVLLSLFLFIYCVADDDDDIKHYEKDKKNDKDDKDKKENKDCTNSKLW